MEQTEILDTLWEQLYAEAKIREQGSRESCYFQQWMCNMENLLMDALSLEHKTVSFYRQGFYDGVRLLTLLQSPPGNC